MGARISNPSTNSDMVRKTRQLSAASTAPVGISRDLAIFYLLSYLVREIRSPKSEFPNQIRNPNYEIVALRNLLRNWSFGIDSDFGDSVFGFRAAMRTP